MQKRDVFDDKLPAIRELKNSLFFQGGKLSAHGLKREPEEIGDLFACQRKCGILAFLTGYDRPPHQHREEGGNLLRRGLSAQKDHPVPRRVKLIERHFQHALSQMRRLLDHPLERAALK